MANVPIRSAQSILQNGPALNVACSLYRTFLTTMTPAHRADELCDRCIVQISSIGNAFRIISLKTHCRSAQPVTLLELSGSRHSADQLNR
jgi:hypothetical protein